MSLYLCFRDHNFNILFHFTCEQFTIKIFSRLKNWRENKPSDILDSEINIDIFLIRSVFIHLRGRSSFDLLRRCHSGLRQEPRTLCFARPPLSSRWISRKLEWELSSWDSDRLWWYHWVCNQWCKLLCHNFVLITTNYRLAVLTRIYSVRAVLVLLESLIVKLKIRNKALFCHLQSDIVFHPKYSFRILKYCIRESISWYWILQVFLYRKW